MSPISLVFLLFAQMSVCNQRLPMAVPRWVTTSGLCLTWTLPSTGLLPCPLPSSPGLRSSCLWAAWSLSPWGSDPSTPTLSPAIFSLRVLGCIFTEGRKQKEGRPCSQIRFFGLLLESMLHFATVSPKNIVMW